MPRPLSQAPALLLLLAILLPLPCHCSGGIRHLFGQLPGTASCSERFLAQPRDHFDYSRSASPTWRHRYFLCDSFLGSAADPPVFFYAGNEGNVENYVNNTGLMWELGAEVGALLVFAEHRYYGKSRPVEKEWVTAADFRFLSMEQALRDYIRLLQHLKEEYRILGSPVVAFGGSYGGQLAAFLRMKFPNVVYAALAASAPLRCQLVGGQGSWDASTFWQVVTRTASPAGGCAADCAPNVRAAFSALVAQAGTAEGRARVSKRLSLCPGALESETDAKFVGLFLLMAFDNAAQGSLPYPSAYFGGDPAHPLPAWPMRAMCQEMAGDLATPDELLHALGRAVNVLLNATGAVGCYSRQDVYNIGMQCNLPKLSAYSYQVCTQFEVWETAFPTNGRTDMFWDQGLGGLDPKFVADFCRRQFGEDGPVPDYRLVPLVYSAADLSAASNIILSNGLLDPWSSCGFLTNISDIVVALVNPEGGHHSDLMFSHPEDPPSYGHIRAQERRILLQWLAEYDGRACAACWGAGGHGAAAATTQRQERQRQQRKQQTKLRAEER